MSRITADRSLGDLVTAVPGSARIFESHGLDYCCGGQARLDEACAAEGVVLGSVMDELTDLMGDGTAGAVPGPDWATMRPSLLVDHLELVHHAYLHAELPRLGALADKVAGHHGERHPELVEVHAVYKALWADLEPHMMREERVLFPAIRALDGATTMPTFHFGSPANPISVMLREHDNVGELLAQLRRLTGGYQVPADGCGSYREFYEGLAEVETDTHLHVHKENNLLFPAVLRLEEKLASAR